MRIAVVGAGIGGLTAALALRRHGFEPIVHEAADEIRPVGAGIWVPSNALRVLDGLGVASAIADAGVSLERARLTSARRGVLQEVSFAAVRERFGFGNVAIQRSELHRVLLAALPAGSIRLGRRLVGLQSAVGPGGDEREVRLDFEGDVSEHADIVVGADGARSVVRGFVDPGARLRDAGQSCYRGIARCALPAALRGVGCEIWGGAARFGFSEVGAGSVYWFAPWIDRAREAPQAPLELLGKLYSGFPEPVAALLEATAGEALVFTRLGDLAPLERWWRGRVVLVGDAAHATTPNLGQGGAQAIEDAAALAAELAGYGSGVAPAPEDLARAFAAFEARRRRVAQRVVARSRTFGWIAHWRQPLAVALRDRVLRAMSERRAIEQLAWLNEG